MKWLLLLTLACTRPNPGASRELCLKQGACGSGVYSACSENGCSTRYLAGSASFRCASCSNCQSALSQVLFFCAGGGTTGGDGSCANQATSTDCSNCCANDHPSGYQRYIMLLATCECVSPGACKSQCAASFCLDSTQDDALCDPCLANSNSGGVCDVSTGCELDGDCAALLACAEACPP